MPSGRVDVRHLRGAFDRMGLLQIDAVNVLARSHLLVLRARMGGSHDAVLKLLERAAYTRPRGPRPMAQSAQPDGAAGAGDSGGRRRELTEYWSHEASFVRVDDWPLYRWHMRRGEQNEMWSGYARYGREQRPRIDQAAAWLADHGPATSAELDAALGWGPGVRGPWGTRSNGKMALAWLFWAGHVGVDERVGFTRRYDVIDRVLPADVLAQEVSEPDAHRALLRQAAGCLGVATAEDLIDYHRLPKRIARARIAELVEDGALLEVQVEGWDRPAYVPMTDDGGRPATPRRRSRSVLLSPFDPLVWFRPRAERLFGFHYRIEIYVPKAKRQYGYFVLPFLHNDALVARLDVRFNREARCLEVPAAWAEPNAWPATSPAQADALEALAAELHALARWCNANTVAIAPQGTLADPLRTAVTGAEC